MIWTPFRLPSILFMSCQRQFFAVPSKIFYFFLPAALSPMNTKILSLKSPCRFKRRSLSQHGLSHLRAWTWSYFRQSWTLPMVKGHPCVTKLILYFFNKRERRCKPWPCHKKVTCYLVSVYSCASVLCFWWKGDITRIMYTMAWICFLRFYGF